MNVVYKIEFHTDWHCGSGLAAGADVDELVIKDKNGLPFVPGKTIKGLVSEAVADILFFSKADGKQPAFDEAFGANEAGKHKKGVCFFTNAELPAALQVEILAEEPDVEKPGIVEYLYRTAAATAIDKKTGTAKEHSLRRMETVVPCTLVGEITNVPQGMEELIANGLAYIKRLGKNRNRGLGRCTITIIDSEEGGSIS
ncbi:RAMP superfamily CRISPR-associated protein [Bacteroides sp. OttesenSCG-928-E20]|nr:RAMP superfamily CRISPR-associated protein [Bacteroides sp. OttesenSCG-928-N06]MDL2299164.1 RAMP superfamily CRISPR-associated protein [Bacteroides sp. OttesenSCG-928-E20]MDL2304651.1 RAMP superfamily CRISPR-associated protein [Bacteroides sp. OttesenSCG-928-D19]